MQPTAQSRFADHLCRFLATATAPRFATGQWLKSLSEDDLYRLNCLIGLALEHHNERAWDDLAMTCIKANSAERGTCDLPLSGDQLMSYVTTLRVISTIETLRRKGRIELKTDLTIQPDAALEAYAPRWAFTRRAHFAH
jgi:hypothetical protein